MISSSFSLDNLTYNREDKKKTAFYASDVYRPSWELWNAFMDVPKTNPTPWYDYLKMEAGSGVEKAMLKTLKDSGIVNQDYDQNIHGKISFIKDGVEIHGRVDAITIDGFPIEIKSINNKNSWNIKDYENGYPRENYVGQLSIYMDALGVDTGFLFVSSVDGLSRFWFKCVRNGNKFTCGNTVFDLDSEIARWKKLKEEYVDKSIEPDVFEFVYKHPIDTIDWKKVSADKISKARNNRAVIGDYQVVYSGWKDLWIAKQGQVLGYTAEELIKINELTNGYTTWKK